jgi:multiple sugar transport system substrate-binding protein
VPTTMPTYLEEFAYFKDSLSIASGQRALLGEITPQELASEWAAYLTKAQQNFLAD